jgi:hypothetical protein
MPLAAKIFESSIFGWIGSTTQPVSPISNERAAKPKQTTNTVVRQIRCAWQFLRTVLTKMLWLWAYFKLFPHKSQIFT